MTTLPAWLDARSGLSTCEPSAAAVETALAAADPGPSDLAALLSPAAAPDLEAMAQRAQALTRRHFGSTISLYAPLYLANHCSSGCAYCGFAADRGQPRHALTLPQLERELAALKGKGLAEVLLLTGERCAAADFGYLRQCAAMAAAAFPAVGVEAFAMSTDEYRQLAEVGVSSVTIYQETYDLDQYERLHRWGPKRDYAARLEAPARALAAGLRTVGLGVLLGLSEPRHDALCLFLHARHLQRLYWRSGITLSFPRLRSQAGGFAAPYTVSEAWLAQLVFAMRLVLPEVPLLLSTRERPAFRDGMAGVGISKMSVASRTTVGGYADTARGDLAQFDVSDERGVDEFCASLRQRGLEPVFKNWDAAFRDPH
jgi:2-iminoacetate synthase